MFFLKSCRFRLIVGLTFVIKRNKETSFFESGTPFHLDNPSFIMVTSKRVCSWRMIMWVSIENSAAWLPQPANRRYSAWKYLNQPSNTILGPLGTVPKHLWACCGQGELIALVRPCAEKPGSPESGGQLKKKAALFTYISKVSFFRKILMFPLKVTFQICSVKLPQV